MTWWNKTKAWTRINRIDHHLGCDAIIFSGLGGQCHGCTNNKTRVEFKGNDQNINKPGVDQILEMARWSDIDGIKHGDYGTKAWAKKGYGSKWAPIIQCVKDGWS